MKQLGNTYKGLFKYVFVTSVLVPSLLFRLALLAPLDAQFPTLVPKEKGRSAKSSVSESRLI